MSDAMLELPPLSDDNVENISKRRWKRMQSKTFRKLVIKRFGRPEQQDVKYVSFMLTEKHALIEITGEKITHKIINTVLEQYNLGPWTFIETRPEFQPVSYWFGGERVEAEEFVVRSFYRTDREDAIAILKSE